MNEIIEKLRSDNRLNFIEARALQTYILRGKVTTEQLIEILTLLDRPLAKEEFEGLFAASQEAMLSVETTSEALDTCGTGGDGHNTFNISTGAAIVCAAAGVPVAKHGNRAASSACGSADVLEALGIKIDTTPEEAAKDLLDKNFTFMFAPQFHPAFRYAAAARAQFKKRSYFNLLGPLLNPARAPFRVLGVSIDDPTTIELLGRTLLNSGAKKIWIVHGENGLDEISTAGPTTVYEFTHDKSRIFSIHPTDFGLSRHEISELRGGAAEDNATIIGKIFNGSAPKAHIQAVVMNAAAGLTVSGRTDDYTAGLALAAEVIRNGEAARKFEQLIKRA